MKFLSLRTKIILSIIASCLLVAVIFAALYYPFEKKRVKSRLDDAQVLLSSIFEQNEEELANEIFAGQGDALAKTVEEILSVKGISGLTIYGLNGAMVSTTQHLPFVVLSEQERVSLKADPEFQVVGKPAGEDAVFTSSIEVIGEHVGFIKIYYDLANVRSEGRMNMLFFALLLVFVLMLMSVFLNIVLFKSVIKPVRMLRNAMHNVQKGQFGEQVRLNSADEIGDMAKAFNNMSAQLNEQHTALRDAISAQDLYSFKLQETNQELERLNAHLEVLVDERTKELVLSNRNLQGEIAERKRIEASLAAEKKRLAVTLRSIGDGVIATDTSGGIVLMNEAAELLTGVAAETSSGKPIHDVLRLLNENGEVITPHPLMETLETGRITTTFRDVRLIGADAKDKLVFYSAAPIRGDELEMIGAVLVFRDISEHKRLEEESQKSAKLESLGILAGGIAHDFNNIMTAILGNLSLARMYAEYNEKVYEKLVEAEKATLHAKGLTRQLLTFSKGGAPIKTTTSVGELIKDTANFALSGSKVSPVFDIPEDLWALNIDATQISQVINNIIINANQAMPGGGFITVRAENVILEKEEIKLLPRPDAAGRYVIISIEDEGPGIPDEILPNIFDPYFTTKERGSGLGLSTSYSIIKNHGGGIEVRTGNGSGAGFSIYLPALTEKPAGRGVADEKIVKGMGRVLVMDDESVIRDIASEALGVLGYIVETAVDGRDAIEKYIQAERRGEIFDVVIMDLTIPGGVGGRETITNLKYMDPEIKAIVSSGYSEDPVMADYESFGFDGVLPKPFKLEELSAVMKKVMDN